MIIGLIIGGVLVGRDMINSTKIRKQISQFEKFDTATNTFRNKYNCLPGDCANATQFGFGNAYSPYSSASGNGDGAIYCNGPGSVYGGGTFGGCISEANDSGENGNFWLHLSQAGLITPMECQQYDAITCNNYLGRLTPRPILEYSNTSGIYGGMGLVHLATANVNTSGGLQIPFVHGYFFGITNTIGTILRIPDVISIDNKLDDGLPGDGKVRSVTLRIGTTPQVSLNNSCADTSVSPAIYRSTNSFSCSMLVKTSF